MQEQVGPSGVLKVSSLDGLIVRGNMPYRGGEFADDVYTAFDEKRRKNLTISLWNWLRENGKLLKKIKLEIFGKVGLLSRPENSMVIHLFVVPDEEGVYRFVVLKYDKATDTAFFKVYDSREEAFKDAVKSLYEYISERL